MLRTASYLRSHATSYTALIPHTTNYIAFNPTCEELHRILFHVFRRVLLGRSVRISDEFPLEPLRLGTLHWDTLPSWQTHGDLQKQKVIIISCFFPVLSVPTSSGMCSGSVLQYWMISQLAQKHPKHQVTELFGTTVLSTYMRTCLRTCMNSK